MEPTTTSAPKKEATMAASRKNLITVDISNTVGQSSAIEANGGPVFQIRVTQPAVPGIVGKTDIPGFGKVVSGGPVDGHEVLYTAESVI